jgi:aryl-alcohol dehydrogenase-like predicted oxidoreductase
MEKRKLGSAGLGGLGRRKGRHRGQLALSWVLVQGDDVAPIPGTKHRHVAPLNEGYQAST